MLAGSQGDHLTAEPGVRGEDSVISVAVDPWRRHEPGQALEQLEGREEENGPAVGRGSG